MEHETRLALVEERYDTLEKRMTSVEEKLDGLRESMNEGQKSMIKTIYVSLAVFTGVIISSIAWLVG